MQFLTNFKKEARGYDVKYNIKGDKLTINCIQIIYINVSCFLFWVW